MCTSVNKFGSSNASVLLHVQTEVPISEESSDHNEEDEDGIEELDYLRNPRQTADKKNIQLLNEGEIFWIPFLPHPDHESQAAENYPHIGTVLTEDGNFEAAENVDEVTQRDCAILHAVCIIQLSPRTVTLSGAGKSVTGRMSL